MMCAPNDTAPRYSRRRGERTRRCRAGIIMYLRREPVIKINTYAYVCDIRTNMILRHFVYAVGRLGFDGNEKNKYKNSRNLIRVSTMMNTSKHMLLYFRPCFVRFKSKSAAIRARTEHKNGIKLKNIWHTKYMKRWLWIKTGFAKCFHPHGRLVFYILVKCSRGKNFSAEAIWSVYFTN